MEHSYLQKVEPVPTYGSYAIRSTKLHSLAREYEEITHEEYCCKFEKFHQKLVLKISIFALRGSVRIQNSSLVFWFLNLRWKTFIRLLLGAQTSFTGSLQLMK
jgi:hypothetical protein